MGNLRNTFRGQWLQYVASLALVAAVTGAIALIRALGDVGNISMVYVLAVLGAAIAFGSGPAIASAIAAFLAYNFFFIEPRGEFSVANEDEWIALVLLLVTGVITGQLAASLRERARQTERREREATVLYDVVRLMGDPELERALTAVAERLRTELGLSAVLIVFGNESPMRAQADTGDSEAIALARQAAGPAGMILGAGQAPTASERGQPGRWIRVVPPTARADARPRSDRVRSVPVNLKGQPVGSIVLVPRPGARDFAAADDRLLSAVANQLGLALERLRLQGEATEAEVLRRTDQLRTALLNAVSHDLRTPLSSIIASAGLLLQTDVDWSEEDRREFARAIEQEAGRLDRLVGNLLDLSRIQAGNIRPEKSWYDLRTVVDEAAARLRGLTGDRLTVDVPEGLPPVEFDYIEIDQVVSNLIENAVKHTPPDTAIRVSAAVTGGEVQVEVTDRGPGVPAGVLPHVFEPFYRGPRAGGAAGSGLGLAVAKGLVEAHGGRIWVENGAQRGARFIFTLPLGETPPVPVPMPETAA
jgi:two-component system, OmpR family, sensor histidine kinase KdpD